MERVSEGFEYWRFVELVWWWMDQVVRQSDSVCGYGGSLGSGYSVQRGLK